MRIPFKVGMLVVVSAMLGILASCQEQAIVQPEEQVVVSLPRIDREASVPDSLWNRTERILFRLETVKGAVQMRVASRNDARVRFDPIAGNLGYTLDVIGVDSLASILWGGTLSVTSQDARRSLIIGQDLKILTDFLPKGLPLFGRVEVPVLTLDSNSYEEEVSFSIMMPTKGAWVRYTLDGSTPTESSPLFVKPVHLDRSTTIKAFAFKPGWVASPLLNRTIELRLGAVNIPRPGVEQSSRFWLTVAPPREGATVRYTLDGSDPTLGAPVFVDSLFVESDIVFTARAFQDGWTEGPVVRRYFFMRPVAFCSGAVDTSAVPYAVHLSSTDSGANIHYTLDGTEPDSTSPVYVDSIHIAKTTRLRYVPILPKGTKGLGGEVLLVIATRTAVNGPYITAADPLPVTRPETLTVTSTAPKVVCTTDGSAPTVNSPQCATSYPVDSLHRNVHLRVLAFDPANPTTPTNRVTYRVYWPYGSMTDPRDGQRYRTLEVGGRTWMAQNLAYAIPAPMWPTSREVLSDSLDWATGQTLKIYSWIEALQLPKTCLNSGCSQADSVQGICPTGWHIPTSPEWDSAQALPFLASGNRTGDLTHPHNALHLGDGQGVAVSFHTSQQASSTKMICRSSWGFTGFEYDIRHILPKASWAFVRCVKDLP